MIPEIFGLINTSSFGLMFPVATVLLEMDLTSAFSVSKTTGGCAFFFYNQNNAPAKAIAKKTKIEMVQPFFIYIFVCLFVDLFSLLLILFSLLLILFRS